MSWSLASRHRWRAALRIHQQLLKAQTERKELELPREVWALLNAKQQLHQRALNSNWLHAQTDLEQNLLRVLTDLVYRCQEVMVPLKKNANSQPVISVPELWRELEFLSDEFEEVECDLEACEIRVTTDAIELEGVNLSRFQIILEWKLLGNHRSYRIKALDPNAAESNEDMVHPHVNHGSLCEGDGSQGIRQALQQGRLLDFFILVRQILTTYNPSSAYLTLERWYGTSCQSCSSIVDDDDAYTCPCCGDFICGECTGYCHNCTDTMCQSCVRSCPHCENYFCTRCMIHCSTCVAEGCDACLVDGFCPSCQTPEVSDDDEFTESTEDNEEQADAETDPLCVGQVALSA